MLLIALIFLGSKYPTSTIAVYFGDDKDPLSKFNYSSFAKVGHHSPVKAEILAVKKAMEIVLGWFRVMLG